jgi:hypothetical protein
VLDVEELYNTQHKSHPKDCQLNRFFGKQNATTSAVGMTKVSFPGASFDEPSETFALQFEREDNPGQFRQILTDEESRKLLNEHKSYLKRLVAKGHKDLECMGFHGMTQSSLRSIITEKLDWSMMSLHKLEADSTDATE